MAYTLFSSWDEFNTVRNALFGNDLSNAVQAVEILDIWSQRGNLPHAIEQTLNLSKILTNIALNNQPTLTNNILKSNLGICLLRMVNGFVDRAQQQQNAASISWLARKLKIPISFVDIRHSSTHNEFPSDETLLIYGKQALAWLRDIFWNTQANIIYQARIRIWEALSKFAFQSPSTQNYSLDNFFEVPFQRSIQSFLFFHSMHLNYSTLIHHVIPLVLHSMFMSSYAKLHTQFMSQTNKDNINQSFTYNSSYSSPFLSLQDFIYSFKLINNSVLCQGISYTELIQKDSKHKFTFINTFDQNEDIVIPVVGLDHYRAFLILLFQRYSYLREQCCISVIKSMRQISSYEQIGENINQENQHQKKQIICKMACLSEMIKFILTIEQLKFKSDTQQFNFTNVIHGINAQNIPLVKTKSKITIEILIDILGQTQTKKNPILQKSRKRLRTEAPIEITLSNYINNVLSNSKEQIDINKQHQFQKSSVINKIQDNLSIPNNFSIRNISIFWSSLLSAQEILSHHDLQNIFLYNQFTNNSIQQFKTQSTSQDQSVEIDDIIIDAVTTLLQILSCIDYNTSQSPWGIGLQENINKIITLCKSYQSNHEQILFSNSEQTIHLQTDIQEEITTHNYLDEGEFAIPVVSLLVGWDFNQHKSVPISTNSVLQMKNDQEEIYQQTNIFFKEVI